MTGFESKVYFLIAALNFLSIVSVCKGLSSCISGSTIADSESQLLAIVPSLNKDGYDSIWLSNVDAAAVIIFA